MKLSRLIEELGPVPVRGNTGVEVTGIALDSRRVSPGDLFVAVPGARHNGADFIFQARERGAVGVVVEEFTSAVNGNLAQVKADNPRRALSLLSNRFFNYPSADLKMIGVTGTNGKTTVSILGRAVLESAGISTGLLGTIYYGIKERRLPSPLTTPAPPRLQELLAEMKRAEVSHAILEVSSHAVCQERLAGIEFSTAIFTNLSREHLDFHRTLEGYRAAKLRFFQTLYQGSLPPERKIAIVNLDDPLAKKILSDIFLPSLTYGFSPAADISVSRVVPGRSGTRFQVRWRDESYSARISMPGRYNVANALAVIALGISEGIDIREILSTLEKSAGIPGRLERVETGRGFDLFVDYAHTPDGLENVLKTLRELYSQRLIVVFGCGGDRDPGKRPLMGQAADRWADTVILTSDNPRSEDPEVIIEAIRAGISRGAEGARQIPDRREAIREACRIARPGDAVLIAGKGHEREQIFADRIIPFDDREVARQALADLPERNS